MGFFFFCGGGGRGGVFVCFVLFLSHDKQYLLQKRRQKTQKTFKLTKLVVLQQYFVKKRLNSSSFFSLFFNIQLWTTSSRYKAVFWSQLTEVVLLLLLVANIIDLSRLWWFKLWKLWAGSIETYSHIILVYIVQNLLPHLWFFFLVCWLWDKLSVHVV